MELNEKLGALGEPKSPAWPRVRVEKMLEIDLPDLLFEVHSWTGFLGAFVRLGDGTTPMRDLTTSAVALLVSEARNVGMTPVADPGQEPLTCSRRQESFASGAKAGSFSRLLRTASAPYSNICRS